MLELETSISRSKMGIFSEIPAIETSSPQQERDPQTVDVSIVMPCLNEAETLEACIEEAQHALDVMLKNLGLRGEIVIGDNGSTDGSQQIATRLGARIVHISHKGYGNALRGAIEAAHGQYIIMGDSDGSYDFQESVSMVEKLDEDYDLCMGSRFQGTIMPGAMPWKNRYIGNPLLSGVLNLMFHSGLSDAHCGLRAFTKDAYKRMRLDSQGMEFASEMVIKATLVGLKSTEVPITLRPDGRNRPPHLKPWRDGWRHLRYILMLSPAWIFFIPSIVLGLVGLVILMGLLVNPGAEIVYIGPLPMGDHWMIIASALIIACYQILLMGLVTTLYGIRSGYRKADTKMVRLLSHITLERMLILGVALLVVGFILLGDVFIKWSASGFGALDRLRVVTGGANFILLGINTFFGGFLLAVVNGNQAEINLTEANQEPIPQSQYKWKPLRRSIQLREDGAKADGW